MKGPDRRRRRVLRKNNLFFLLIAGYRLGFKMHNLAGIMDIEIHGHHFRTFFCAQISSCFSSIWVCSALVVVASGTSNWRTMSWSTFMQGFNVPKNFWDVTRDPPPNKTTSNYSKHLYNSYISHISQPLIDVISQSMSQCMQLPFEQIIPPQIPKIILSFTHGSNIQHATNYYLKWKKTTTFNKLFYQKIFFNPPSTSHPSNSYPIHSSSLRLLKILQIIVGYLQMLSFMYLLIDFAHIFYSQNIQTFSGAVYFEKVKVYLFWFSRIFLDYNLNMQWLMDCFVYCKDTCKVRGENNDLEIPFFVLFTLVKTRAKAKTNNS